MTELDAGPDGGTETVPGPDPATDDPWIIRHGWLLSAIWLVFMVFPLLSTWAGDATTERKIGATGLCIVFAVIYVIGFQRHHRAEQRAIVEPAGSAAGWPAAGPTLLVAMIAITGAAYALVGVAAFGLIPFVVSYAVFNLGWAVVGAVLIAGVATTVVVPLADGTFDDVWFLSLIVLAVGGTNILIRIFSGHEIEQGHLRTNLAISDERGRVARDVHDVLGHSLTAVILKAELCQRLLDQVEPADDADRATIETCQRQLNELHSVSRSALAEIRSTVGGLRAANLPDEITVARTVLADAGVDLLVTGEPSDVPETMRPTLAWVVREAATNIVRHARASTCHIELVPEPARVWLRVSDDGIGLGPDAVAATNGNGLRGLRERVASTGARLEIVTDDGTRLEVIR